MVSFRMVSLRNGKPRTYPTIEEYDAPTVEHSQYYMTRSQAQGPETIVYRTHSVLLAPVWYAAT